MNESDIPSNEELDKFLSGLSSDGLLLLLLVAWCVEAQEKQTTGGNEND